MSFNTLGLHPLLVQAVAKAGYETPTPVQQQAIPAALQGRDLMVSSATGSGKTAAFMLPALQILTEPSSLPGKGARVVVLTPTRELAMQVTRACEVYGKALPSLKTVSILGGVPYAQQQRLLRQPLDVMVATPGRLIDYIQRGQIDFSRVQMLVLDEADRMLDMGFIEDIEHIVSSMPKNRQTLMFSATFGGSVGRVAAQWLRDPLPISVETVEGEGGHANIDQRLHYTRGYSNKLSVLEHLLKDVSVNQAIVFTATQREADSLSDSLSDQGFVSAALHGGMNQRQRSRTLQQMHQGRLRVLVATDVAARGLDVEGISHVINFDLPKMAEDYVHRIGRTGRAGRHGVALTLADIGEQRHIQRIERFTTQRIPVHAIDGLAPIPTEAAMRSGRGGSGGGGGSRDRFAGGRSGSGSRRPTSSSSSWPRGGEGVGRSVSSGFRSDDSAPRRPRFDDDRRPQGTDSYRKGGAASAATGRGNETGGGWGRTRAEGRSSSYDGNARDAGGASYTEGRRSPSQGTPYYNNAPRRSSTTSSWSSSSSSGEGGVRRRRP